MCMIIHSNSPKLGWEIYIQITIQILGEINVYENLEDGC